MSRKPRGRVMAWAALLLTAWMLCLPATSGALPIRWWEPWNPTVGDPDQPGGNGIRRTREERFTATSGFSSLSSVQADFYFFLFRFLRSSRG